MDIFLDWCERYPFYFLDGDADMRDRKSVSLTDSEYADYKRVMAEFDAWQDKMNAMRRSDWKPYCKSLDPLP